ncbi:MAG: leucine-rich repeat domain-containing protein [Clostridia bacterium]|nr:leucine-rich repeat domain-containing protein [Clostridia bacterium]
MKRRLRLLFCVLAVLLTTVGCFTSCGSEDPKTVTDQFGYERPNHSWMTECLILPEYPSIDTLFGTGGESGLASEAALEKDGQITFNSNYKSCFVVYLIYASSTPQKLNTYFDLTYLEGVRVLDEADYVDVQDFECFGDFEAKLDMNADPKERLKIECTGEGGAVQGVIIIPLHFANENNGTMYIDLSVSGVGEKNSIMDTEEVVQVGFDMSQPSAKINEVSIGYLAQSKYNNGSYSEADITDTASFANGEACYMVLDFAIEAIRDHDGNQNIHVVSHLPQRGSMSVTIEEAPTGQIKEEIIDNITTVYAAYSVPTTVGEVKTVRMLLRLLPISGGEVELKLFLTGDETICVEGSTYISATYDIGESALEYTLSSDRKYYTVTGILNKDITTVTIPDALGDGIPVSKIADELFKDNTKIKHVIIGNCVTELTTDLFSGCKSLESVTIGEGVTSLEYSVFIGCDALRQINYNATACSEKVETWIHSGGDAKVIIGANVKYIPDYLFKKSDSISSLVFEEGSVCETIGEKAFLECDELETVSLTCGTVGRFAFGNCKSLKRVDIDITGAIGEYAFYDCTALTDLTIGKQVSYINNYAFSNCRMLTNIQYNAENAGFQDNISGIFTSEPHAKHCIFENAGQGGNGIQLTVGANVTRFPGVLFFADHYTLPKLTSVVFEEGSVCSKIGMYAFYGCIDLTSIKLPNSLKHIGEFAFARTGLTEVTLHDGIETLGRGAFKNCQKLQSVTVGNGVERISQELFSGCRALEKLTVGSGVRYIDSNAFYVVWKIKEIRYMGDLAGWHNISVDRNAGLTINEVELFYINGDTPETPVLPNG